MNCSISMHADDTDVFYTVPDTNEIMKILQNDFNVSVNSSCAHPPPRANHGALDNLEK